MFLLMHSTSLQCCYVYMTCVYYVNTYFTKYPNAEFKLNCFEIVNVCYTG